MLNKSNSDNVNSAIANATQLDTALDETCPYQNSSFIETSDGLPFHIVCDQDMAGWGDYLPWGFDYRPHTDTMSECMELCSHAHPLCLGVSWNSDLRNGFGNCYLKNAQNGTLARSTSHTHSGLVKLPAIDSCDVPIHLGQILTNDRTFQLMNCTGPAVRDNITSVYKANYTGCIEECATYNGTNSNICTGVLYDNSFDDGFENCYLLNGTIEEFIPLNSTYARLVSDNSSSSDSKAWIAGPVVGAVAAVTIVALGYWWWRRKAGRQQDAKSAFIEIEQSLSLNKPVSVYELHQIQVTAEMEGSVMRHEMA